jgi:hypothetical protein
MTGAFALAGAGSDPGDVPGSTWASASAAAAADVGSMIDWGLGLGRLASDDDRDATG